MRRILVQRVGGGIATIMNSVPIALLLWQTKEMQKEQNEKRSRGVIHRPEKTSYSGDFEGRTLETKLPDIEGALKAVNEIRKELEQQS